MEFLSNNCLSPEAELKSETSADVAGEVNFSIVKVGETQMI